MPSEPGWEEYLPPVISPWLRSVTGIPSMTNSAWLLWVMDFGPRITTRVAPPMPADEALMLTPATLPLSEFMKLAFFTVFTLSPPSF